MNAQGNFSNKYHSQIRHTNWKKILKKNKHKETGIRDTRVATSYAIGIISILNTSGSYLRLGTFEKKSKNKFCYLIEKLCMNYKNILEIKTLNNNIYFVEKIGENVA